MVEYLKMYLYLQCGLPKPSIGFDSFILDLVWFSFSVPKEVLALPKASFGFWYILFFWGIR